jgi:hypothetical protein
MHQIDVFSFTLRTLYPDETASDTSWREGLVSTKADLLPLPSIEPRFLGRPALRLAPLH